MGVIRDIIDIRVISVIELKGRYYIVKNHCLL